MQIYKILIMILKLVSLLKVVSGKSFWINNSNTSKYTIFFIKFQD